MGTETTEDPATAMSRRKKTSPTRPQTQPTAPAPAGDASPPPEPHPPKPRRWLLWVACILLAAWIIFLIVMAVVNS